jgi:hypothetical protein
MDIARLIDGIGATALVQKTGNTAPVGSLRALARRGSRYLIRFSSQNGSFAILKLDPVNW